VRLAFDLEDYHPSVLLHCWLGHLTCKIVSEMTYNVLSGTLNPTIPYHTITVHRTHFLVPGDESWSACVCDSLTLLCVGNRHDMNRCLTIRVDSVLPSEKWKSRSLTVHNASVWVGG